MPAKDNGSVKDDTFYPDNWSYLSDELRMLDVVLRIELARQRRSRPSREMDQYKGLVLFDEDMAAFLENKDNPFAPSTPLPDSDPEVMALLEELNDYEAHIRERCGADLEAGRYLALPHLSRIFGLSRQEELCLVVCLAPELDLKYERLYAYLNDDITRKRAGVSLILNLISRKPEERLRMRQIFDPGSPLFKYGLLRFSDRTAVQVEDSMPLLSRAVGLDERIVKYLLGIDQIDSRLDRIAELVGPVGPEEDDGSVPEGVSQRIHEFVNSYFMFPRAERRNVLIHLHGPRGSGKLALVRRVCRDLNMNLLTGDVERIIDGKKLFSETIWWMGREALLQQGALCLNNFHNLLEIDEEGKKRDAENSLFESLGTFAPLTFILGETSWQPRIHRDSHVFIDIGINVPGGKKRHQIWERYRSAYALQLNDADTVELAGKFRFTPGRIREAVLTAGNHALWSSSGGGGITKEDIYNGCRAQSNPKLRSLARKITPLYTWDDIVLPPVQKTMLREICGHVKYHHVVYDEWGFDRKVSLGNGLTILFSGPSGTGKTMAAEVIANELGLELYKIDLSQIVSKYIGETEKNLDRVFTEARTSNSILFFDEADALFGKRSEVKDAHDRYANIEIAYLLQKMEEYDGITILATNLRQNMDDAFLRRMRFSIEFPFPEERQRELIWNNIFPVNAPLSGDIDYSFLSAKFKLTGGNIRNVALTASFYAAGESSNIQMQHIILAVQRELQKIGKLCVQGEFGKYYELIEKRLKHE